MDRRQLPNLARLIARGVSGPLSTISPMLSPIIWTTIATGKNPEKHGVGWFMVDTDAAGSLPVNSTVRRCKALWNIVSENDLSVGVVGWWATYPAETVKGVIVSDYFGFHNFGVTGQGVKTGLGKTYPPGLRSEVEDLMPRFDRVPFEEISRIAHVSSEELDTVRHEKFSFKNPLCHLLHIVATAEGYTNITERILDKHPVDLLMVYYEAPDSFSHLFMRYRPPRMPGLDDQKYRKYSAAVDNWYVRQDELVGRLLAKIDPETAVLVVSDHGFKSGADRPHEGDAVQVGNAHNWHAAHGVFVFAGPGVKREARISDASVRDITPTILYYLGLPVARDMDGDVLVDAFTDAFLGAHRLRYLNTYEGDARSTGEVASDSDLTEAVRNRLEALGYVGSSSDSSSTEIHANLATSKLESGDLSGAEREIKVALRMRPNDPSLYLELARIRIRLGRLGEAWKALRQAAIRAPEDASVRLTRGLLLAAGGRLESALGQLVEAWRARPGSYECLLALGKTYCRLGQTRLAEAVYQRALAADPTDLEAYLGMATVMERSGRLDEAERTLRGILEVAPDLVTALLNLGSVYSSRRQWEAAADCFRHVLKIDPGRVEGLYNLGTALLQMKRFDEARKYLEKTLDLVPDFAFARNNLGLCLLALNRPEEALKQYLWIANTDPNDYNALYQAGCILHARGRPEAKGLLTRARALAPNLFRQQASADGLVDLLSQDRRFDEKPAAVSRVDQGGGQ